ncbi:hypothetical protein R4144_21195 [Gordonia amicalis]|uniref:hypothetical protein n=1 Tax=Gordonia amicalis TaxID=89053 RepID=UPI002954DA64|nr:hypothetical protein [Gordonia amicalis]MDV7175829.1 hypothetical protein [Gordonia amicalis]
MTGRLSAYPAAEGQFVATAWDRERDVVVVGGISARWDPAHGDPLGQSIVLALSWHDDSPGGVEATGIVSSVHQLFYEPAPDPEQPRVALRQPVSAVEKFPADLLQGNGTVLVPGGVEVVLDELVLVVPTAADAARARGAADEGRRTLTIVCPAPCLGTVVPYEGERIRIDLDDDRLTISGSDSAPTGTVTGVVLQLGRLEPAGPVSMVVPVSVPADTPTDDVAGDVLVVFVVDPTD